MKKRYAFFAAFVFLFALLVPATALAGSAAVALGSVSGSSLTNGAAYSIGSEADLAKLASLVNGGEDCTGNFFVLTADISLTTDYNGAAAGKWTPIGSGTFSESPSASTAGNAFNGTFYGQNHTISGLDSQTTSCSGLFGNVGSSGIVTDLTVSGTITGANCAGGVAAINQGSILNCTGSVVYTNATSTAYSYIGGIVGANQGTLQNCENNGSIAGYKGATGGDAHIGGIAGYCKDNARILDCANTGNVTGWSNVGGILGSTNSEYEATIRNCYNTGNITAYDVCGGIVGLLNTDSHLSNCYTSGSISSTSTTDTGAVAGHIFCAYTVANCYWLEGVSSKSCGQCIGVAAVNFVSFTGTDTLSSSVEGTTSLSAALDNFAAADSYALRGWTGGSSLPVLSGTVVLSDPENAWAVAGSTVDYTSIAVGSAVTYQWQVSTDGTVWNNVSDGSNGNTPTYTTAAATASMDGCRYRCVFSGTVNSASATFGIGVAPDITTQPVDYYAASGETASFSVAATGAPTPYVCWYVSTDHGASWIPYLSDYTVYLPPMDPSFDGFLIKCELENDFGLVTSNTVTLYLASAPAITTQPSDKTAVLGKTATFSVRATGGPPPSYQWQINRGSGWSDISGANEASYTTAAVELLNDGYQYRVIVSNTAGTVTSDFAALGVVESAAVPTTGDTAHPWMWLAFSLLALSGLGILAAAARKRSA